MTRWKPIVGWTLLGIPLVGQLMFSLILNGWRVTLLTYSSVLALLLVIGTGVYLITHPSGEK
jgi:hypothetical protein